MSEISKDFDGVLWEWKGRKDIRDLKPICPKCKYELNFGISGLRVNESRSGNKRLLSIILPKVTYLCSKCDFSSTTNINGVGKVKDLRKAVLREFEHRIRIKVA
jgi:hypothetical protein